jgi:hypothetical protein
LEAPRRADVERLRQIERRLRDEARMSRDAQRASLQVLTGTTPATMFRGSALATVSRNLRLQLAMPLATGVMPQIRLIAQEVAKSLRGIGSATRPTTMAATARAPRSSPTAITIMRCVPPRTSPSTT